MRTQSLALPYCACRRIVQALSMTATQVIRILKVTPFQRWFSSPNGDSPPTTRSVTSPVMDAYYRSWPSCARQHLLLHCPAATYPLGRILRQPALVSFSCVGTEYMGDSCARTWRTLLRLRLAATQIYFIELVMAEVDLKASVHRPFWSNGNR